MVTLFMIDNHIVHFVTSTRKLGVYICYPVATVTTGRVQKVSVLKL